MRFLSDLLLSFFFHSFLDSSPPSSMSSTHYCYFVNSPISPFSLTPALTSVPPYRPLLFNLLQFFLNWFLCPLPFKAVLHNFLLHLHLPKSPSSPTFLRLLQFRLKTPVLLSYLFHLLLHSSVLISPQACCPHTLGLPFLNFCHRLVLSPHFSSSLCSTVTHSPFFLPLKTYFPQLLLFFSSQPSSDI